MQRNPEDNPAQARSDATADEVGDRLDPDYTEQSDRAHGRGSDANGVPEFDEVEGEERKKPFDLLSPVVCISPLAETLSTGVSG